MKQYDKAHDMDSWMRDKRIDERGFAHRWQSSVGGSNGEDLFIELLNQYLQSDSDVLDLGCGHGEFTLELAGKCRSIVGIERNASYLELAKELTTEQKVTNVQFHHVNLAGLDDEGRVFTGIPIADNTIDLFVNRRGPLLKRYLDEALRVARRGAVIVGLHPAGDPPAPTWRDELPEAYQNKFNALTHDEVMAWVTDPLTKAGISDYSLWWVDVPEFIQTPDQLHARLGGTDIEAFQKIKSQLQQIIETHRTSRGLALRHRRLLWQCYLPE